MTDLPEMQASAEDEEAVLMSFARKRNEIIADLENELDNARTKIDALRAALDEAEQALEDAYKMIRSHGERSQKVKAALARIREVKRHD